MSDGQAQEDCDDSWIPNPPQSREKEATDPGRGGERKTERPVASPLARSCPENTSKLPITPNATVILYQDYPISLLVATKILVIDDDSREIP
ncbi:MAG: hypothetical protein ACWA5T_09785 [Parvularcula sp.]